jgi:pilus assembly protein Flp/PilA
MRKLLSDLVNLKNDESGAALIEYTVLLGILVVAVIALITAVGTWVAKQWSTLNTTLNTN